MKSIIKKSSNGFVIELTFENIILFGILLVMALILPILLGGFIGALITFGYGFYVHWRKSK